MIKELYLNIHNIKIQLKTDSSDFFEFVSKDLYYFIDENKNNDFKIVSNIFFHKSLENLKFNHFEKIGANAYINKDRLVFQDKQYDAEVHIKNEVIFLDGYIQDKKNNKEVLKDIVKKLLGRQVDKNHYFLHILRKFILFPTFYYQETFQSKYVMHASAFTFKNKSCFQT